MDNVNYKNLAWMLNFKPKFEKRPDAKKLPKELSALLKLLEKELKNIEKVPTPNLFLVFKYLENLEKFISIPGIKDLVDTLKAKLEGMACRQQLKPDMIEGFVNTYFYPQIGNQP